MSRILYIFRNTTVFFSIENIFSQVAEEIAARGGYTCEKKKLPLPGLTLRSLLTNGLFARRLPADIFHVTGDVHYITLFLPGKKTVLTIHDCGIVHQNSGLKRWLLRKLLVEWPVRHCRLITTVSETTKKDIMALTGCATDKIVVIPNPVNRRIFHGSAPGRSGEPVFLFIGITPNKNLPRVIEAIRGLPCLLDIVGKLPGESLELLLENKIHYRNSFDLSDQEIAEKYAAADLVLFPSLFEGFGMPIIEGQQAGRPVVTSDLSPMKDVAGGAACLVDPLDADSIRAGIEKVMNDEQYRDGLIEKGRVNAQRFTIATIAGQYLETYKVM